MSTRSRLLAAFSCDLRSLAALRIALGGLLLADLAWRLPLFAVLYGEQGAWPIAAARGDMLASWSWSLYFLSGSPLWSHLLFGLTAAAAVALMLGWRTRVSNIVAWVLIASLQTRNPLPLSAGDVMMRMILFLGIFLPLGARWSLDAKRVGATGSQSITTPGTVALLTQVALIYICNAAFKTGPAWHENATAIADTLRVQTYVTPLGAWLGSTGLPLGMMTQSIWWLELFGPLLVILPWGHARARLIACLLFMGFHMGLFATLRLGLFPLVGIVIWIPFLPGKFWERLGFKGESSPAPKDEHECTHCLVGVLFALTILWNLWGLMTAMRLPWLMRTIEVLRIQQRWQLFAPHPPRSEGRMMAVVELADGREMNPFTDAEVNWERPADLGSEVTSAQWRKFLAAFRERPSRPPWLAEWILRTWNTKHPTEPAQRVRLHYLWEWIDVRQSPPDNWLIYEDPPGPLSKGIRTRPPRESSDN